MKILITSLLFIGLFFDASAATTIEIKKIKGEVFLNQKLIDQDALPEIKEKDFLEIKDDNSFIHLVFPDGSQIVAKKGSFEIEAWGKKEKSISLIKGLFGFVVEKKKKPYLQIKTKHVSMGIRGTKFVVEEDEKQSYLCVCEGVVEIKNKTSKTLVKKNQDVWGKGEGKLKASSASKDMIEMSEKLFQLADINLTN